MFQPAGRLDLPPKTKSPLGRLGQVRWDDLQRYVTPDGELARDVHPSHPTASDAPDNLEVAKSPGHILPILMHLVPVAAQVPETTSELEEVEQLRREMRALSEILSLEVYFARRGPVSDLGQDVS